MNPSAIQVGLTDAFIQRRNATYHLGGNGTHYKAALVLGSVLSWTLADALNEFDIDPAFSEDTLIQDAFSGYDTDNDGEPKIKFRARDEHGVRMSRDNIAGFLLDKNSGSWMFRPNASGTLYINIWVHDTGNGQSDEVLVWSFDVLVCPPTLAVADVQQYLPDNAGDTVYEFWDGRDAVREQWRTGMTYHIAPIALINLTGPDGNAMAERDIHFSLEPIPDGFFLNMNTGEIIGVPRGICETCSTLYCTLYARDSDDHEVALTTLTFRFLDGDTDNATNGPNGQGCENGATVVDDTEFDGEFTCECAGSFTGDNCEIEPAGTVLQQGAASGSSSSTQVAVVAAGAGVLFVILVALLVRQRSRRLKQSGPHDFHEDVGEIAALGIGGAGEELGGVKLPTELKRSKLKLLEELGKGHFGVVQKALYHSDDVGFELEVAVKVLLDDSDAGREDLFREAMISAQFDHRNVIGLVGVVTAGRPMMLVLQYCSLGSLLGELKSPQGSGDDVDVLVSYCQGVACGMQYLSDKMFVHRDLAARNVLLDASGTPKVSDFGLSRELESEDYYRSSSDGNTVLPLRWTAPEAVQGHKFSEKSDVWSFGVTCVEVFTRGETPYRGWLNTYVIEKINEGYRMECPERCPAGVYSSMILPCFEQDPRERPTFTELASRWTTEHEKRGGVAASQAKMTEVARQRKSMAPGTTSTGTSGAGSAESVVSHYEYHEQFAYGPSHAVSIATVKEVDEKPRRSSSGAFEGAVPDNPYMDESRAMKSQPVTPQTSSESAVMTDSGRTSTASADSGTASGVHSGASTVSSNNGYFEF